MRAFVMLLLAVCLVALGGPAGAQLTPDFPVTEELRIRQSLARTSGYLDKRIEKILPSDQVVKFQRINRKMMLSWDINAFAAISDKDVIIPIGFIWAMEQVSHALAAAATMQAGDCASLYLADLRERVRDNARRVMKQGKPRMIQGFFDFCNVTPACYKHYRSEKNLPPEHQREFERGAQASVAFVYLHELAHHMLGHSGKQPKSMAESQSMEFDADQWALEKGLAAGENVVDALPLFVLMESVSEACKGANCTHPSGVDRFRRMVAQARAFPADKLGEPLKSNTLFFRAAVDRQEGRARQAGM